MLTIRCNNEIVWIEPWGRDALRVRACKQSQMPEEAWALENKGEFAAEIEAGPEGGYIRNGKLTAKVSRAGALSFVNQKGELLLEEYFRNRRDITSPKCSALDVDAREFKPILGGDYTLAAHFESDPGEKLYGMGQYQQPYLDLKGCEPVSYTHLDVYKRQGLPPAGWGTLGKAADLCGSRRVPKRGLLGHGKRVDLVCTERIGP